MARISGLLLALFFAWDFYANAKTLETRLLRLIEMRHLILINPQEARLTLCKDPKWQYSQLFWREDGLWVDSCQSHRQPGQAPRYWRLVTHLNYRMLFHAELPITFAIVMKH